MKNVLIAFDKFKDALTALEACQIAEKALARVQPEWQIDTAPLADGGDGFCHTLTELAHGRFETIPVMGPLGEEVQAMYGVVDTENINPIARALLQLPSSARSLAVVEFAQSSGLMQVPQERRSPWETTSFGLGQVLRDAKAKGADAALVGLGGSATHDLALGALQALGYRFSDRAGNRFAEPPIPADWHRISKIDSPSQTFELTLRIACDVENPLLGPNGAAAVFGPQKGLDPADLDRLESETARMAILLCHACNCGTQTMAAQGVGAAGGAAFGLMNGANGQLLPGAELVFAWNGLERKLAAADLVVTGEGKFDASSLQGKAPGALAKQAIAANKRVAIFAGSVGDLPPGKISACAHAISPPDIPLKQALADSATNLQRAICETFATGLADEA